MRPAHRNRLVKLYANDENGSTFPVMTFIWPINCSKVLDSPFAAHRWVSGFKLIDNNSLGGEMDSWTSVSTVIGMKNLFEIFIKKILASKSGDVAGLAILLCSLLSGFGLDAYVACGYREKSPWCWVVTLGDQNEVTFWEPTSTERQKHIFIDVNQPIATQKRPNHTYKTIDCLFNHKSFYGNIQPDNRVPVTRFQVSRASGNQEL